MKILGIETSCDETSASVIEIKNNKIKILSNVVLSQINIHRKYGGVVPEVAARTHVFKIIPVLKESLKNINTIDLIAVTSGPGLITSLLVGVQTAQALAYAWQVPLIGINHIEAHILSNWLVEKGSLPKIKFPALCLVVSGGHTELVLIKKIGQYQIIGQTLDDAAGECFDKAAKILGLSYPGGPIISRWAKKGDKTKFYFPRPMINSLNFDFSFSGLKTAVLYLVKGMSLKKQLLKKPDLFLEKSPQKKQLVLDKKLVTDICASFQEAAVDVLIAKTIKAAKKYNVKTIMLAGGVSANTRLRQELGMVIKKKLPETNYQKPITKYSTDNAAMIALAGYFTSKLKTGKYPFGVNPNMSL